MVLPREFEAAHAERGRGRSMGVDVIERTHEYPGEGYAEIGCAH